MIRKKAKRRAGFEEVTEIWKHPYYEDCRSDDPEQFIPSADEIADRADSGEDISKFFSNNGTIKYPKQRISMDIPADMLKELDDIASELNLNRQAVIVTYLRHALNQHHMSQKHAQS